MADLIIIKNKNGVKYHEKDFGCHNFICFAAYGM